MDYIQEELRQQQEALAALLLGGGPRQQGGEHGEAGMAPPLRVPGPGPEAVTAGTRPAPEGTQPRHPTAEPAPEGTQPRHPTAGPMTFAAESRGGTAPGGMEGPRPRTEGAGGTAEDSPRSDGPAALAGGGRRDGNFTFPEETAPPPLAGDGTAAGIPGSPAAQQRAGDAPWERTVTEYVCPAGGGSAGEAEALSRAFQRDARRYDGGFSLY